MEEIDRWALQQLERLRRRLTTAYEQYQYHLVYHALQQFCGVTLSSFYLDILKDRLYTLAPADGVRRSARSALHRVACDLCRLMAPVLAFTAEEIWQELERMDGRAAWADASVHVQLFPAPLAEAEDGALLARWDRLLELREPVQKALELARKEGQIGSSLEAVVTLASADGETLDFLRSFPDLHDLFLTSGVEFAGAPAGSERTPGLTVGVQRAAGQKCERCWHWTTDVGHDPEWPAICARCVRSVRRILSQARPA
jgi:isoleucyl-tRNA synthetase